MPLRAKKVLNLTAFELERAHALGAPLDGVRIKIIDETPQTEEWRVAEDNFSARKLIKLYYKDKLSKPSEGRQRGILHPSQLNKCRRYQQYDLIYAVRNGVKLPPQMQAIWDNGHSTETRLRNALTEGCKKIGATFKPSIKTGDPRIALFGETDGVVTLKNFDQWVVDFKTINSTRFEQLHKPSEDYIWQFTAYMHCMRIPQTLVYYENKDTQKDNEFVVRFDEDLWDHMMETVIRYTVNATVEGRLVDRDEDKCGGSDCPFNRVCFSNASFEEADQRPENQKRKLQVIK